MTVIYVVAADLGTLATGTTGLLTKIVGLFFILFLAVKFFHCLAQDRPGAAIGLLVVALIPALFIFDPTGAAGLLKSTVKAIGG